MRKLEDFVHAAVNACAYTLVCMRHAGIEHVHIGDGPMNAGKKPDWDFKDGG